MEISKEWKELIMERNAGIISIIVAVYNAEKYINECVQSILNQTYRDIQLILVNDGSVDNSQMMCEDIANIDNRVVVINKKNGGCYSAWNAGLNAATGEYIGFVDNDDYIVPEMYETMLELLLKHHADIVSCNRFRNVNEQNNYQKMDRTTERIHEYSGYEATKHLLCDTRYLKPAVWDKLYKRKVFETLRFPNTFFEDAAVMYRLLFGATKIIASEKQLYAYSVRPGSMITSPWNMIKTRSYLDVTNSAIKFFEYKEEPVLLSASIYWQIQFGIEACERIIASDAAISDDYKAIMKCLRMHYRKLDLKLLKFDWKKYLKKKIEFSLFIKFPKLLCKMKKMTKGK